MKFGVHVSIAGSLAKAVLRAKAIRCDTFQIFTRNPRSWIAKELTDEMATAFKREVNESGIYPIFSHMPYLPNIASQEEPIYKKSLQSLEDELIRCDALSIPYTIIHLGSAKNAPKSDGLKTFIKGIDSVFDKKEFKCGLLLENTAGKEGKLGSLLEDLYEIISKSKFPHKIGICFDTCHAFASGYDIRSSIVLGEILDEIDEQIGLEKLKIIHCNDSVFDLGSGRDRHEHIGMGKIGIEGFKHLLSEKRLRSVPFICETPVDYRRNDRSQLEILRCLLAEIEKVAY
ncbi:MAG: deoxyribonuclease IV [Candidatus Heimdallarchaeota archaeon]|nr:MAG: endonuclease [Candidatus Gerdarchaeota archaeon]